MFRHTRCLFAISTLALIGVAPFAHAQTYTFFPNDATINYAINTERTIVGYASGDFSNGFQTPSSPTVSLVSGGSAVYLDAFNSSTVNMSGGSVRGLYARDSSIVNVSNGDINDGLVAINSSTVNFSGGNSNAVDAFNSGTANVSGGRYYHLAASGSSTMNVRGGTVVSYMAAYDSAVLNFTGRGLEATLINPNAFGNLSQYRLSGTLLDGTVLTNYTDLYTQNGTGARFTLTNVPAPSALAAFVIGAVPGVGIMLRRRRK